MADKGLKKQQMEYIGIGLLVFVALFVGISRFRKKNVDDEVFSRKEFNRNWEKVEILEAKVPQEEKGIEYNLVLERSPLKSPFEEEKREIAGEDITLPAMEFQGMLWGGMRPQAIIDNKVYNVDDTIEISAGEAKDKVKIEDITRKGIYLKYKGKKFIVRPR